MTRKRSDKVNDKISNGKSKPPEEIKELELPRFFDITVNETPSFAFLPEVGFDRTTCNRTAWLNFIQFLKNNPDINVVLIDGAVSRLDRPEYLIDEMTHWLLDRKAAEELTELTPSYEQFTELARLQRSVLKRRLTELKEACPNVTILWSTHSDGMQFSFTYRLNEILVGEVASLQTDIENLNGKIGRRQQVCREAKRKKTDLNKAVRAAKNYEEKRKVKNKITTQDKKIKRAEAEIEGFRKIVEELTKKAKLFRPSKISPIHQVFTRELTEAIYENLDELAVEVGATHIPGPAIIKVNDLVIDYSHSRHPKWGIIVRNDENLLKSFVRQGLAYIEQVKEITGGHAPNIVLQSHHGTGWSHVQRLVYHPDSLNFNDLSRFDSTVDEEHELHFVVAPTFEDQSVIEAYLGSNCPTRMGLSAKPMNTRNHYSIDRYSNGGVAGMIVLTKNEFGIGKQIISYEKFKTGEILEQPKRFYAAVVASDEHICHPAEDPLARLGFLTLLEKYSKEEFVFRGKPTKVVACLHLGDIGEPNRSRWPYRPDHKLDANQSLQKAVELATTPPDDLMERVFEITRLSMSGLFENMDDVYSAVADYLMGHLEPLLRASDLKYVLAAVPGNHIGNIADKHGIKEFVAFKQRLIQAGIEFFEVGRVGDSVNNVNPNVRVALGGYENAYSLLIDKFGLSKDNKPLFGPVRVFMIHNPKGSGKKGTTGSAINSDADLTIAGHTHEKYTQAVRTVANRFKYTLRAPTLQKVTGTEIVYASSPARTSGACMVIMPSPEDVMEFHLDMNMLREVGREAVKNMIAKAQENK